jgi:hypothetical protein
VKVARYLAHEDLTAFLDAIEELAIATVQLVERPSRDANAVEQSAIDLAQRDLRLGMELDFVGNVVFFRRSGSLAQSSGRYTVLSSRT